MRPIHTAALALTTGLLATTPVLAGPTKPVPSDPIVAQVVAELHKVVQLLNEANHDYQGHRAEAVHYVHKAIHALHPHRKAVRPGTTPTPKPPTVKQPAPKEDQAKSDAQLKAAIQALQTVQTQLSSSTAAHHKKAAADLQAAIAELNTALAIK
jgi:hypothetical protein